MRPYEVAWADSGNREAQVQSAAEVLRFAMGSELVLDAHRVRLINDSLWFVTEADGKYSTRYRSRGVLDLEKDAPVKNWRSLLRHEHVFTRKSLAKRLRAGEDPAAVLADAVACIVTVEEHERLSPYDNTHNGWDRYAAAGVEVVDMLTMERYL